MKKLIAILLSMLMLCSVIPFATVAAADATTVQLSIVDELTEVNAGEEVQVQVDLLGLEDTAGLISILVRIDYDPDVFELVTYFDEDEEMWMPPIEVGAKYNASSNKYITFGQISEEGKMETCLVKWTRATATATQVRREEHFYTVTFKVKDDAPSGTYDLIAGRMDGVFYGNEKVVFADPINTSITVNGAEAPSCEHEYDNACDVDCNLCGETREVEHNVVAVEAKDATCTELGNIAYWYCDVCGQAWLDEACTQNTNLMAVKLPMVDHEYFYACDPVCMNCYEITNPDAAHSLSHVEAKDATCFENGNVEYWTCEYCGGCWDNEAATGMPLNQMMVVVPMAHDELTHVEAKAPTCFENGNIEYWYCDICGSAWLDEYCHLNTNLMAVKLPMADHTYDDDMDVDCNVCGDIRVIEYEVKTFGGNSIAESNDGLSGLAFKFSLTDRITGMAVVEGTKYVADYTNAYVTPDSTGTYKLVKMGAKVSNGKQNLDIPVKKIVLEGEGAPYYAIRIINIPEDQLRTLITCTPYFVYEDNAGQKVTVELDSYTACAADFMD